MSSAALSGLLMLIILLSSNTSLSADDSPTTRNTRFYDQFIPASSTPSGYVPSIQITVSNIPENDAENVSWYSDADPNAQFNKLWLEQKKPGYNSVEGSKVLNRMLRFSFKKVYKNVRSQNINSFNQLPNEEGNGRVKNWKAEMEYTVRATDDSIKMGMEYKY
jgi:hypothetical protein